MQLDNKLTIKTAPIDTEAAVRDIFLIDHFIKRGIDLI